MRGEVLLCCLLSVSSDCGSKLSVGFAASKLAPMTNFGDFIAAVLAFGVYARILLLGLLGYVLSVLWWY